MEEAMTDHSQCGESTWILENLKPEIGTFCEVGAFDGVQSSNTLLFEQLGWTGMVIEADPYLAAKCQQNRTCPTMCCAVGNPPGWRRFFINEEDRGLSGIDRPGKPVTMMAIRLDQILSMSRIQCVDLLSIDTEGTELEVWESIGWHRPRIIVMEYQTCSEPSQEVAIMDRMLKDGYSMAHKSQYNLIFTR
jgi:FkbM family methyltransferase